MKKLLSLSLLAVGLMAMLVMTGCGGSKEQATSAKAKKLNLALAWFGDTADPAHGWDAWTLSRIGASENLVTVNDKMEFTPVLADKWTNVEPTIWSFHIRKDVKFQNGDALTPALVKASLERTLEVNPRAAKLANIKEIRIDGENIIIETNAPSGSLVSVLTEPLFAIINTSGELAKSIATAPVLTGPYRITEFKTGEEIKLKKNEHYWNGTPALDTLNVYHIGDDTKRAMGLQSGDFDLINRVASASLPLFEGKDDYKIYDTVGTRTLMLTVNHNRILGDANLRNGVAELLDYENLASVYGGGAKPAGEPFPPSVAYGHPGNPTKHSKEMADASFKAAGYSKNADGMYAKDGEVLTLQFATWGNQNAFYEAIEAQLREGGIKVNMVHVKEPDNTDEAGGFDLLEENWIVVATNDPYAWLNNMFHGESPNNRSHYNSSEYNKLVESIGLAMDDAKKNELVSLAAKKLIEDKPALFLAFPTVTVAAKKSVKNVPSFPMDYYLMTKDITVE